MSPRLTGAVVALAIAGLASVPPAVALDDVDTRALRRAVTGERILRHERALQVIANKNAGTRASGTPGFAASLAYVQETLEDVGYSIEIQNFPFNYFQELAPPRLEQSQPRFRDFTPSVSTLTGSGSGEFTAPVQAAKLTLPPTPQPSSSSGCSTADFEGFEAGSIALIQRGTCSFSKKAGNAAAMGAAAVVIFNEGQPGGNGAEDRTGVVQGTMEGPAGIPVFGTSYAVGLELAEQLQGGVKPTLILKSSTLSERRSTSNLIATARAGDPESAIVVGSHLDSVTAGPGINDNGSGTATNLELAVQIARSGVPTKHLIKFAFWGAEELGLVGSQWYVDHLGPKGVANTYANLNFDMLGSPNYGRFVMAPVEGEPAAPGNSEITSLFERYFSGQGLASEKSELDNRSDYAAFNEAGIPVGGLFTGAERIMTGEMAALFGTGAIGKPFDSCYHQACDTIANLNPKALSEMAAAAAHGVLTLALSEEDLNSRNAVLSKPAPRTQGGGELPDR